MCQLGECTSGVTVGRCVRACGERERELVQVSCNSVREMRYGLHVTSNDRARLRPPFAAPAERPPCVPSARQMRASRATFQRSQQAAFDLPLQAADHEHVANNSLQRISYGMGFYSVGMHFDVRKPVTGGEGVRPVITTATTTHSTPQIFYLQLARMRTCPTPVAWPTVASATVV